MDNLKESEENDEFIDNCSDLKSCLLGDSVIILNTRGAIAMTDGEYPARYGIYHEIRTREFTFHFNPTGEIRYMRGLTHTWPHPWEWLKRTWGNDWVYYSVGLDRGQGRVKEWMGENYIPCFSYKSNAIREVNPYTDPKISKAFSAWSQLYGNLCSSPLDSLEHEFKDFIKNVINKNEDTALINQAEKLHEIIDGRVSVLPPDTRHVDYEVVPLNIADGCLYRCKFCSVKTGMPFKPKSISDITKQIDKLKEFYNKNLQNINAIYMGGHDALAAGVEHVAFAAEKSFKCFNFENNGHGTPSLFLFGSAGSFLKTDEKNFKIINELPFRSYINLGLEAYDEKTLKNLGKPITPDMVYRSLHKMIKINETYKNIEVTANFLLGTPFSNEHKEAIIKLLSDIPEGSSNRGCIYLSPLVESQHREEVLPMFHEIKKHSNLQVFIYLIQRL